ncbi:MAG: 1,4-beta-xylanase [Alphaproteobacteria bacterium]|nr:MAG: 1,4-beta-xylanase [Alphaproteobacteria bacterium]
MPAAAAERFELRAAAHERWTSEAAHGWYSALPWLVGCNFTPSYAINQLEFWQAETFDLAVIDRELQWAAELGMNAARVYLHDLLWHHDAEGFVERIHAFLATASRHGIRTMLVLFDSCWDPHPALGPQGDPRPGVHNSGWVQSPGDPALSDPSQHDRLRDYVAGIVAAFARDERVLAWDIWNEPDNGPEVALCDPRLLAAKASLVAPLLIAAFGWARSAAPEQPLTSGIWLGDWSAPDLLSPIQRAQTAHSDFISFHNYGATADFDQRVRWLKGFGRPTMCTEYMARSTGSTFEAILPSAKEERVAAFCWGLVRGRTQTNLAWNAEENPLICEGSMPWFHDILHPDGTPHLPDEVAFLRRITGRDAAAQGAGSNDL